MRATVAAGVRSVHLKLSWAEVQRRPAAFDWIASDEEFQRFRDAGLTIESLRVMDAPDWAVRGRSCPRRYKSCPPTPANYSEFGRFVKAAVNRYGPGTPVGASHFVLWNEPNLAERWGGKGAREGGPEEYSDLLVQFSRSANAADPRVIVDAGEIAAGDRTPVDWAKRFTRYSTQKRRNADYDVLTIHPYSAQGESIAKKAREFGALPGVTQVGITEFGWAVGQSNPQIPGGAAKCASETGQAAKFQATVDSVRATTKGVRQLVWLNVIDQTKDKAAQVPGRHRLLRGFTAAANEHLRPLPARPEGFADAADRTSLAAAFTQAALTGPPAP